MTRAAARIGKYVVVVAVAQMQVPRGNLSNTWLLPDNSYGRVWDSLWQLQRGR